MERVGVLNITTCVHMYQVSAGRHDFLIFWRGNVVFPNDSGKNKLSMKIDLSIYFTNYGLKKIVGSGNMFTYVLPAFNEIFATRKTEKNILGK